MAEFNPELLQNANQNVMSSLAQGYGLAQKISGDIQQGQDNSQMQADMADLAANHDPKKIAQMTLKYPQMGGTIKQAMAGMDAQEREQKVNMVMPIYAAALNGRIDVAKKILQRQLDAATNSGADPKEIEALKGRIQQLEDDPETFKNQSAMMLSYAMGPENFSRTFGDLNKSEIETKQAPYEQMLTTAKSRKEMAAASIDEATAPYAGETARAKMEAAQLEPQNILADNATNLMTANAAQGLNALKQQELSQNLSTQQRDSAQKKIDSQMAYQNGINAIDSAKLTIANLLKHPGLNASPKVRAFANNHQDLMAGSDSVDFINQLKTLGGKNFATAMESMKGSGLGTMSDNDVKNLQAKMGSLDPGMSNKAIEKTLSEMQDMINKSQLVQQKKGSSQERVGIVPRGTVRIPRPPDFEAFLRATGR